MKNGWIDRLWEVVDADPRSDRAISLAANLGPNYVSQTRSRETYPVSDKLNALLDALGEEAAIYVMTGVRLNPDAVSALNAISAIPESLRQNALALIQSLAQPVTQTSAPVDAEPDAFPQAEADPTRETP